MKRVIIGAGQCGMKLATEYFDSYPKTSNILINLSTSVEDSVNVPRSSLVQVAKSGSGKRFSNGEIIWRENFNVLNASLSSVRDSEVLYFVSAGGGSGSSSIKYVTDILLKNNNKILLSIVLPFSYENLPYKPNSLQALSRLQDDKILEKISVLLFDNDKLYKKYFLTESKVENGNEVVVPDLKKINQHIIFTSNVVLDLVDVYHTAGKYTPFSIDKLEHESVIFSKGFIGVDLQSSSSEELSIKFDYGSVSDCKNIIIAKTIRTKESDYIVDQSVGRFIEDVKKVSKRAKNARVIYGVIRNDIIENGSYLIIGNNLDISKYTNRTKAKIAVNIENFKKYEERDKVLNTQESVLFDV